MYSCITLLMSNRLCQSYIINSLFVLLLFCQSLRDSDLCAQLMQGSPLSPVLRRMKTVGTPIPEKVSVVFWQCTFVSFRPHKFSVQFSGYTFCLGLTLINLFSSLLLNIVNLSLLGMNNNNKEIYSYFGVFQSIVVLR